MKHLVFTVKHEHMIVKVLQFHRNDDTSNTMHD